jgi:mutator protein MutT
MSAGIEVTAGVIRRGGSVLVCRRAEGSLHASKWEFPGGKREPGESLEQCLRRELREELGIAATIGPILAATRHHYAGRGPVELTFFDVPRFEGAPMNIVFAEIRWVPIPNLEDLDFLEADREFVRRLSSGELSSPPGTQ